MDAAPARPRAEIATAAFLLALLGVGIALVLLLEHLTVFEGDAAGGLLCGGAGRFDCNAVAAHDSAWLLGLPLPLWGLLFYLATATLALYAWVLRAGDAATAASAGLGLALAAVVFDAYLGFVMVTRIGALCIGCLATYAVNLGLVVAFWQLDRAQRAWLAAPAPNPQPAGGPPSDTPAADAPATPPTVSPRGIKVAIALAALAAGAVAIVFTTRSIAETLAEAQEEAVEFIERSAAEPPIDMSLFAGRPAIGPENARIQIVVASDFQCTFCRALANRLEAMRRERPNDFRFVFLHSPVSTKCNPAVKFDWHEDACWLAKAGLCAAEHGRFWEYHDLVYHEIPLPRVGPQEVTARIAEIGIPAAGLEACVASADADSALKADVDLCRKLEMTTVPALVINGHIKRGGIYPTTLRTIVKTLLAEKS